MNILKRFTTGLLLLTVLLLSGVVNAKLASGVENFTGSLHPAEITFKLLWHQAKIRFSYDDVSGSPVVPKNLDAVGRPVPAIRKTLDQSLNPQQFANDVATKYGINLRGTKIVYDPNLPPGNLGTTTAAEGGNVIRIGPDAFADESTLANTIAHELSHARDYRRGFHKPHGRANSIGDGTPYGSGNALQEYIEGRR